MTTAQIREEDIQIIQIINRPAGGLRLEPSPSWAELLPRPTTRWSR